VDTLVLASSNSGKLKEIEAILRPRNITLVAQSTLGVCDADETGLTYLENAIIKARHACEQTNLPSLADDSGISIDALGGEPGIYSARYAGTHHDSTANIKKCLDQLADVADEKRTAHFYCTMVLMQHAKDPAPLICIGKWSGRILRAPQGTHGFGYDPIFWVDAQKCSAAQLDANIKNTISHRARALKQLQAQLTTG
jgi:XTP/dITP diphosphohydrolase